MPSASARVRPRGTGRVSGTTACAARDRSHAQRSEHGEDPPVVAISRAVQDASSTRGRDGIGAEDISLSLLHFPLIHSVHHAGRAHSEVNHAPLIQACSGPAPAACTASRNIGRKVISSAPNRTA